MPTVPSDVYPNVLTSSHFQKVLKRLATKQLTVLLRALLTVFLRALRIQTTNGEVWSLGQLHLSCTWKQAPWACCLLQRFLFDLLGEGLLLESEGLLRLPLAAEVDCVMLPPVDTGRGR